MTSTELGLLVLAILAWMAVGVVALVAQRWHRDEIFDGVTPGVIPPPGTQVRRVRVSGVSPEYDGEVAVAFAPPKGFAPGLVGTVVDGRVDSRDITATIVDLAVRGYLTITAVPADKAPNPEQEHYARRDRTESSKVDWIVARNDNHVYGTLSPREQTLIGGLLGGRRHVRMSQLGHGSLQAIRNDQIELYREVVRRGWYPRHPQQQGGAGCVVVGIAVGLGLLFMLVRPTLWGVVAGLLVMGAGAVGARVARGRTPRTAEGTAVRVQALGFKKYLATAEADQFKFEEAAGIFSRYLPYAMVFGVAQHWAKVFGDLARSAEAAGVPVDVDLGWFNDPAWAILDNMSEIVFWDSLDGEYDLLEGFADFGEGAAEGLEGVAASLGDFMGSLDFLDGLGEGCDAGGCGDVAGCIDF